MTRTRFRVVLACVLATGLALAAEASAAGERLPVEISDRASHGLRLVTATATPGASGVAVAAIVTRTLLTRMQGLERLRIALVDQAGKVRAAREIWVTPARVGSHDAHAQRFHARLPLRAAAGDKLVVGWIDGSGRRLAN